MGGLVPRCQSGERDRARARRQRACVATASSAARNASFVRAARGIDAGSGDIRHRMEWFSMRKALVTGATGFLGGSLARRLHSEGWEVTAAGRNAKAGGNLAKVGIDFRAGDL